MRPRTPLLAAALALLSNPVGQEAVAQEPGVDARWDLTRPTGRLALPAAVVEASGLTFTADGRRLLVHGDELGVVLVVDPARGRSEGGFAVGSPRVEADLEGIAAVGPRLFLVTSTGYLYEFREAEVGSASPVRVTDTRLGRGCEVEGLEYDPAREALLLACKTVSPAGRHALVHRVPLRPGAAAPGPIRISLADLEAFGVRPRLRPSAVALDPRYGTVLLLAARDGLLVEVDQEGAVRSVVHLPRRLHPQPEGLAVGPDGTLWIADEGQGREPAHLTWYAPRAVSDGERGR